MSESMWHRFGYWMETFALGRRLVLRREHNYPQDGAAVRRYTNRVNGHYVVTGFKRATR